MTAPTSPYQARPSTLMDRAALALTRLDLGVVPHRAREEARSYLRKTGSQFDGSLLVDYCLEGRAGDGDKVLQRSMLHLRSRLLGEMWQLKGPPSRAKSLAVRFVATLAAKSVFFLVQAIVILVLLILLKSRWPDVDIYQLADRAASWLTSLFR